MAGELPDKDEVFADEYARYELELEAKSVTKRGLGWVPGWRAGLVSNVDVSKEPTQKEKQVIRETQRRKLKTPRFQPLLAEARARLQEPDPGVPAIVWQEFRRLILGPGDRRDDQLRNRHPAPGKMTCPRCHGCGEFIPRELLEVDDVEAARIEERILTEYAAGLGKTVQQLTAYEHNDAFAKAAAQLHTCTVCSGIGVVRSLTDQEAAFARALATHGQVGRAGREAGLCRHDPLDPLDPGEAKQNSINARASLLKDDPRVIDRVRQHVRQHDRVRQEQIIDQLGWTDDWAREKRRSMIEAMMDRGRSCRSA